MNQNSAAHSQRRSLLAIWGAAFIEGFSTLAVEVIAIRCAVPVVGSSATLTGVMLGVVLFALSAGYWRGGVLSSRWTRVRTTNALARNLLVAGVIYTTVSFPVEAALLQELLGFGFGLALAIGTAASVLFVVPVYLASQTVPMLAELTNSEGKAGKASGKILFFSTLGSVAGGILTPICLFPYLGVKASTYVVCGLLVCAAGLIRIGSVGMYKAAFAVGAIVLAVFVSRSASRQRSDIFSFDTPYQSIRVIEEGPPEERSERILLMDGGRQSGIYTDSGEISFESIRAARRALTETRSENVLVIGAAGFTFPRDAALLPWVKQVDTVDVDPAVKDVAERCFLRSPLPPKVRFLPLSARHALNKFRSEGRHYNFTLLDAYCRYSLPDELATAEFYGSVRAVSDYVAANVIMDPELKSVFANNLLASFRAAFDRVWIRNTKPEEPYITNFLVTNWESVGATEWRGTGKVYTDDRNSVDRDLVQMVWSRRGGTL